ncbi:hypothetical protein DOTSEDRAFT_150816 [Dothistroma septosporum NZE10]|uniref:Major facilitator superfamily (MFS) profile domain-containing protein n=1 Tax=Dothistroma septosporum (strain NZE10 / CBS 128990) TaxID=675120 RepID=N1PQH4_DOTSN|nr:hypothetical protein DOTSEDRAFT_150816 [Dothistroma septosporum NZE10]
MSIGNARIMDLPEDLHLHNQDFNIVVAIFYVSCIICAVPANLAVQISKPSVFLGGLAFAGGVVTICGALVQGFAGLVAIRFLLGISQTGVQAGSILLLTAFYPKVVLHKRISAVLASRLVANACGGLIAYATTYLDGKAGFASWRWLFVMEGVFICLAGLLALAFVPRWPEHVGFLNGKEKLALLKDVEGDASHHSDTTSGWTLLKEVLEEPKLYFGIVLQFCCTAMSSSSVVFLPTVLRAFGWSKLKSLGMTAPVFLAAFLVICLIGAASDHKRLRYPFCAGSLILIIVAYGVLLAARHVSVAVRYLACFWLISGAFAAHATALVWLSNNFADRRRRGLALGIVTTLGGCGFLLGSNVYVERESPFYAAGFAICLGLAVIALATASAQLVYFVWNNKRKAKGNDGESLDAFRIAGRRRRDVY